MSESKLPELPYEKIAMAGGEMPDNIEWFDCQTFLALREVEPEWADVLVPNCVYRCGCPEPNGCQWFDHMAAKRLNIASTDIQQRYDAYNEVFFKEDNEK